MRILQRALLRKASAYQRDAKRQRWNYLVALPRAVVPSTRRAVRQNSRNGLLLCFSSQETLLQCVNGPLSLCRLAFWQPRQDDLLALLDQVQDEIAPEALAQLQISFRPE